MAQRSKTMANKKRYPDRHFVLGTLSEDDGAATVLVRACGLWAKVRGLRSQAGQCQTQRPGMADQDLPAVPWASLDRFEVTYPGPTSRTPVTGDTLAVVAGAAVAPEPQPDGAGGYFFPGFCCSMTEDPWVPVRGAK
jgi:hypothetical protein